MAMNDRMQKAITKVAFYQNTLDPLFREWYKEGFNLNETSLRPDVIDGIVHDIAWLAWAAGRASTEHTPFNPLEITHEAGHSRDP